MKLAICKQTNDFYAAQAFWKSGETLLTKSLCVLWKSCAEYAIESVASVETIYLKTDMRKLESSQSEERRAQSAEFLL